MPFLLAFLIVSAGSGIPALSAQEADEKNEEKNEEQSGKPPEAGIVSFAPEKLAAVDVLGDTGFRHGGDVTHIEFLPGGKRILTSAQDGTARLWDLTSGKELMRYNHKPGVNVWTVRALSDGKRVLTTGGDNLVHLWELETGKKIRSFEHGNTVFRLSLVEGEREFVATDYDKKVILWNLESGNKIREFAGHKHSVYTALVAKDNKRVYSGDSDGNIKIWDIATGDQLETIKDNMESIYTLAHSPDKSRIAFCSTDNCVRVMDDATGKVLWKRDLADTCYIVSWSPDASLLAVTCNDKHIYVLDPEAGKVLRKIPVPNSYHWPVVFSPDGKTLLSSGDQTVFQFDVQTSAQLSPAQDDLWIPGSADGIALFPDENSVFVAGSKRTIVRWDLETKKEVGRTTVGEDVSNLDITPDGNKLIAGGTSNSSTLFDTKALSEISTFEHDQGVSEVAFYAEGSRLVTAGEDNNLKLWNVTTGAVLHNLAGHTDDVSGIAIDERTSRLASFAEDESARVWSLEDGSEISSFKAAVDLTAGAFGVGHGSAFLLAGGAGDNLLKWSTPVADNVPLSKEEMKKAWDDLSADKFTARKAATRTLISGGEPVLNFLAAQPPSDDPEVTFRAKKIRGEISKSLQFGSEKKAIPFPGTLRSLKIHPDGKHWAAAVGAGAESELRVGRFDPDGMKTLRTIKDGHGPRSVVFGKSGASIYTANIDGTISVFRLK